MKKLMRKIAAAAAVLVMSVSVMCTSVSAAEENIIGWVLTENGWVFVMPDGKETVDRLLKIDGILYEFDEKKPYEFQKYTGWAKYSAGRTRRFSHGLPYTGWLKYDDGKFRYCLDGYMVTEKTQLNGSIYSFDNDGRFIRATVLKLKAVCDEKISSDAEEITITLKSSDERSYTVKSPDCMERWEHGRWVNCEGRRKVSSKKTKTSGKKNYTIDKKGDTIELSFSPQEYTNNSFTEGYYRIPVESTVSGEKHTCYAMFQVVPPVEVNTSENIYFDNGSGTKVDFSVEVNSDKPDRQGRDFEAQIFKRTADGWKDINEYIEADGTVSTEVVPINEAKNGTLSYGMKVKDGAGYYKAVIQHKSKNTEYVDYFRIEQIEAKPFSDLYSTKAEKLDVHFDVKNNTSYTVFLQNDAVTLYKKTEGGWIEVTEGRNAVEESSEAIKARQEIIELAPKEKTILTVHISDYYNLSYLEAGEYAVYFSGIGYQSFSVTDEELPVGNYPYAETEKENLKSVMLEILGCEEDHVLTVDEQDMDYVVDCLQHFRVGEPENFDMPAGGAFRVTITYADETTEKMIFYHSNGVMKNGKYNGCSKQLYFAMNKLIHERLGLE